MKLGPLSHQTQKLGAVVTDNQWYTLLNNLVVGAVTRRDSARLDVQGATGVALLIDIDSTLAPTNIRFLIQWSIAGAAQWYAFEEGLFASLYWEDADTAAGIHKSLVLPVNGIDWIRVSAIGTGTDQGNFFTTTVQARPFFGPSLAAHA